MPQVLGDHVDQKGSIVLPDRLRFDVSQPTPITRDDLANNGGRGAARPLAEGARQRRHCHVRPLVDCLCKVLHRWELMV